MDESARAYYWKYLRRYRGLLFLHKAAQPPSSTSAKGLHQQRKKKDADRDLVSLYATASWSYIDMLMLIDMEIPFPGMSSWYGGVDGHGITGCPSGCFWLNTGGSVS